MNQKILQACIDANIDKFTNILKNIKDPDKKKKIEIMFHNHMKQIANYIENSEFRITGKLSEKFIKTLHKTSYPPNYVEKKKNKKGEEIIFMIPGEYKLYNNFPRVDKTLVKFEMKKLINNYNNNINKVKNKFEFIGNFILDFFRIHPFGHGNGMIASLLLDILLLKNNLNNIGLKKYYLNENLKKEIYKAIEKAITNKNYNIFINLLKKLNIKN